MRLTLVALLGLLLPAASCTTAPDNPTWRADVKPIIQANCIKCHGRIARGGAPEGARFDLYLDANGAGFASLIAFRTSERTMPPVNALTDVQIDTIQNWADNGGPLGDPDPDNRLPEIQIEGFVGDEATVTLPYVITDEDFDIVAGTLTATPVAGGDEILITDDLYSGAGEVEWFIAAVQTGSYEITAILDDEHEARAIELGRFTVDRADSNTAPTLSIQTPGRFGTIRPAPDTVTPPPNPGEFNIEFTIEDPEGDANDIEFTLVRGDVVVPVATVTAAPVGPNVLILTMADILALPEQSNYTLVAQSGLSSTSVTNITVDHGN